jgi:galactokinase
MTARVTQTQARELFAANFGQAPAAVASAPGRVNLIGEHTDYNLGFVLPIAIERRTYVAMGPREDDVLHLIAVDFDRHCILPANTAGRQPEEPWADYVLGVLNEWRALGRKIGGLNVLITGDVPEGCGLSSSAALEMALLCALEGLAEEAFSGIEAAQLGQRVENNFLGLNSGIMDQYVSRNARAGHALLLDCRSLEPRQIRINFDDTVFVVANTNCPRKLTASKYNERVAECHEAVARLGAACGRPLAKSLRDFEGVVLGSPPGDCPDHVFRRARHVLTENARVLKAAEALELADAECFGELMNASHESLREDYEVTGQELDAMAHAAQKLPGCHGARMTGAGFGGCTVSLVNRRRAHEFMELLLEEYEQITGICGEAFITSADAGARLESGS